MSKIATVVTGSHIEVRLGENPSKPALQLKLDEALLLVMSLTEAINSLPSAGPLGAQKVSLIAEPSFAVGVMPDGQIAVHFQIGHEKPMEFRFSDESARKLSADLAMSLTIPRSKQAKQ